MQVPPAQPELVINYSPKLDLRMKLIRVQTYDGAVRPDYRLEMSCCLRHPTGDFRYSANDLYFDLGAFTTFLEELREIHHGRRKDATLKDQGEMVVFKLNGDSRELLLSVDIRESLDARLVSLNATIEVDYDLFVNKLREEVERYVESLRQLHPSPSD